MSDRFRFRVWSKECSEYVEQECCDCYIRYNGELECYNLKDTDKDCIYDGYPEDDAIVEQCTCLKDKNGKLIYENDLIKCPSGIYRIAVDDFELWVAIYNNNPLKGVVEWSDMVKEYAFNQENVELEVLGNIHQNPELLKDEE